MFKERDYEPSSSNQRGILRPPITGSLLAVALGAALALSCTRPQSSDSRGPRELASPLFVDPAQRDFTENSKLLERILSSPHGYFRFINVPFSQEVCRRFSESLDDTPGVNLHGDAHLEQYAVTDLGRGLTDFDDSSTGPAVLDLLRFGVSLELTCRVEACESEVEAIYGGFLNSYRTSILEPSTQAPEPDLVQEIRAGFSLDRESYLQWVESIMDPVPEDEKAGLRVALQPYLDAMVAENPNLDAEFFELNQIGYLKMGVGSALDLKFLTRIRGATDSPTDDVVLEIKEVRDLSGIECITPVRQSDPLRILLGQLRIAYQPYNYLGYARFLDKTFWVHAWVDNYREMSIGETFRSTEDLYQIARDVGVQLGRGHTNQIAPELDQQLRREQIRVLDRDEEHIKSARKDLARETIIAWRQFKASAEELGLTGLL